MARLTSLLVVLWVGVTVGSVVDLQKRILGGQDCLNTDRWYHVQLRISYPVDAFVCGGSLISAQWILTAKHCWDLTLYAVVGVHPGPGKRMDVRAHFSGEHHDIMLLEITNPNPNTIQNHYIQLPDCNSHIPAGTVFQIAGHTITKLDNNKKKVSSNSATLQCAETDGVTDDCQALTDCVQNNNPHVWGQISAAHKLCFQRTVVGADAYHGDSGGGVVANGRIYGVISFGHDAVCTSVPVVGSMNVCSYKEWISQTIAANSGG